MSVAIIDINDCGLCCGNARGEMIISPGYALLTEQGITTGNAARQNAYLKPQQSFNQFWRQLNLSPLPSPTDKARHHADLAYAQLLELHRESGSPEEIIFATPGSFDRDQLSIVLGLAKASPFKTLGLVDSAVAAASQSNLSGQLLHLDIQLHQLVLTRLSSDNHIERLQVEVIADIGLKTFYDNWARYIANQFIQQYRYDPLHTAEGEQQLYDLLPTWLEQINGDQELAVSLDSPQGRYRLSLNRNDLLASSGAKLDQLQQKLSNIRLEGETLIASHRTKLLPGLTEQLGLLNTLPDNAAIQGCLKNLESITDSGENIHFITRLPNEQFSHLQKPSDPTNITADKVGSDRLTEDHQAAIPTHILYQHRAQAIGDLLYIHRDNERLRFSQNQRSDIALHVDNGKLYLQSEQPDVPASDKDCPLKAGDIIKVGTQSLQLIEVD